MKETDTHIQNQQNKDKLYQATQKSPQENPERRNRTSN
jgi:hypothetical protein